MPAAQIGVNAALAALQNFWDPAPVGSGVQLPHGAHSPEQAAAALQSLQQQQYLGQAAPHTWSPIRAAERPDPNVWRHSATELGAQHAAPPGAPGGLPVGHGGPPQGAQAAQLGQHAAALLAAYGTCAPESTEVRQRVCRADIVLIDVQGCVRESDRSSISASADWRKNAHSSRQGCVTCGQEIP